MNYKIPESLIHVLASSIHNQFFLSMVAEAWKTVTDKVQDARVNARMKQLSYNGEPYIFTPWRIAHKYKA